MGDNSATGHVLVESEEGLEKFGKRSTIDAFKNCCGFTSRIRMLLDILICPLNQ